MKRRKWISLLLCGALILATLPTTALAEGTETEEEGVQVESVSEEVPVEEQTEEVVVEETLEENEAEMPEENPAETPAEAPEANSESDSEEVPAETEQESIPTEESLNLEKSVTVLAVNYALTTLKSPGIAVQAGTSVSYYDENGKRCITEEDLEVSKSDTNYSERTGVGFRVYPFPSYGNEAVDSTGNSYSKSSRNVVKESYDEMEKEALKAWNADMLIDIFPQKEEFEKENYSPLWSLTLPDELNQILSNLNDIAWKGLIDCIVCKPEDFDAKWDEMQQKLKTVGLKKADQEMTALLREEISRRE